MAQKGVFCRWWDTPSSEPFKTYFYNLPISPITKEKWRFHLSGSSFIGISSEVHLNVNLSSVLRSNIFIITSYQIEAK
jgi:hypothetical protein